MLSTLKTPLALSLLLALAVGCSKSDDTASDQMAVPPPPQNTAPVTPALSPAEAPPVAPPPAGAAEAALAPSKAPTGPAESAPMDAPAQERILAAMQSFVIDNSANPASLEELVARGYLKSLPAAPAGKKWVYNPESLAVELADK